MQRLSDLVAEYSKSMPGVIVTLKRCRSKVVTEVPGGWFFLAG